MSIPFAADGDMDDLPRTLRREKEARQREAREREAQASGLTAPQPDPLGYGPAASDAYAGRYPASEANPATVTGFDVPFFRLVAFFIKAAFAAIPGLLILGVLLWLAGQALEIAFPELLKMKILITFPNS